MKFSTNEDVDAPAEFVFKYLADFQLYERQALRRGADVRRMDTGPYQVGSAWQVSFQLRGKVRKVEAKLSEFEKASFVVLSDASGLGGITRLEVIPTTADTCTVSVSIELKPSSLSSRMLVQSLKLAKTNLTNRFKRRVADLVADAADRYKVEAS